MKKLILSFVFILSATHLFAQVKTGGGGGPDIDSKDGRREEYEANLRLKYIFAELSEELVKIEKRCKVRTSVPVGYNFIDSFYTLSLKKNNGSEALSDTDCEPTKKIAQCLDSKELKKIMSEINQTPGATLYNYLKKEHKLDEKSAGIILKFYTRP